MATDVLTAAVLGLDDQGWQLLDAASQTDYLQIRAVADPDAQKAEKAAARYACDHYTDYRQLIVQNQFDCLLLGTGIHAYDEHVKTAMKKKFNILKLAPPARDYEEALEYVQLAESEKVKFTIANPARFNPSYITAHELVLQGLIAHIFLITVHCNISAVERPTWYADPKLAGGGVLMHDGYAIIDQILWSFPVPQQVYALSTNRAPDRQQRLYLTEDTAVVSLRFTDTLLGSIVATHRNAVGPTEVCLRIYGKDAMLTVMEDRVTVSTQTGQEDQEWRYDVSEPEAMKRLLASFVRGVTHPDEPSLTTSASENLRNMAVLDSIYLSARTGFPEEPARILQLGPSVSATPTSI